MTQLECPHCRSTMDISEWNESVAQSMQLGLCESLIPDSLSVEDWSKYRDEISGRVDCPECGEPSIFSDIDAY